MNVQPEVQTAAAAKAVELREALQQRTTKRVVVSITDSMKMGQLDVNVMIFDGRALVASNAYGYTVSVERVLEQLARSL